MSKSICIKKQYIFAGMFVLAIIGGIIAFSQATLRTDVRYKSRASEPKAPPAVVGSTEVTDWRTWQFVARIEHPNIIPLTGRVPCTGFLIAPQWVVTAAHCTKGWLGLQASAKSIKVKFGAHSKQDVDLVEIEVAELYNYTDDVKKEKDMADIALLKLKDAVNVETITLNTVTGNELEQENRMAVVLGWGLLQEDATIPAYDLRYGVLPLVSNEKANKKDWTDGEVKSSELAAGYPGGGVDACSGDSGGPLVVWDGTKWVLVGVVKKSSYGCGRAKKPGIYTRISFVGMEGKQEINYIKWIGEKIGDPQYSGVGTFKGSPLSQLDQDTFNLRMEIDREWEKNNP